MYGALRESKPNIKKKGATRSTKLLEIIYIDISGSFAVPSFDGENYITFFYDFSQYLCLFFMKNPKQ